LAGGAVVVGGVVVGGVVVGGVVVVGVVEGQPMAIKLMANNSAKGINNSFFDTYLSSFLGSLQALLGLVSQNVTYRTPPFDHDIDSGTSVNL